LRFRKNSSPFCRVRYGLSLNNPEFPFLAFFGKRATSQVDTIHGCSGHHPNNFIFLFRIHNLEDQFLTMNVVVDYGNTQAKVAIFDNQNLIEKHAFTSTEDLRQFLKLSTADHFIISSVNADAALISEWVPAAFKLVLTHTTPLPISNQYSTPLTLGVDRIAGACGAFHLFPDQNTLVIDAGTCITYDFTDKAGNFLGGGISPGLNMRFQAMHTFTAKLPLVKPAGDSPLIGTGTEGAMQSGVLYGMLGEMEGIIGRYQAKYSSVQVILCGGDAPFFENKLKASIFACPNLVLIGLNSILLHNVAL
jgi:type III pantothenate kinase